MSDVVKRILETLQAEDVFLCVLATVKGDGHPSARVMRAAISDDLIIRAPTFLGTCKIKEIQAHPQVHLTCGSIDPDCPGSYFRIDGRAQVSTTLTDRKLAWNSRLAKWFAGPEDPDYAVIRVSPTRIAAYPIGGGPDRQVWERHDSIGEGKL